MLAHAKQHRAAGAHQDQPDARPGRDRCRRSRSAWTICAPPASTSSRSDSICARRVNHLPRRALRDARASSSAIAPGGSRADFASASRVRWCARATAPSARSRATTSDSTCGDAARQRMSALATPPLARGRVAGARRGAAAACRWLGRRAYEPTWRAMQRFTEERDAAHAPMRSGCSSTSRCSRSA